MVPGPPVDRHRLCRHFGQSLTLGRLPRPFLEPAEGERDGYVPNVVYSCGGLVHGDNLVLPFGVADHSISIVIVPVSDFIGAMI